MKIQHLVSILALAGVVVAAAARAQEPTTVILVRHAEKDRSNPEDRDPRLTDAGRARAQELVHVLGEAGVDAMYSTPYRRTRDTARPLAEHLDTELRRAPTGNHAELMAKLVRERHAGQTVVVVGHSDTTPQLARSLGVESPPVIEDHTFDEFWVVTLPAETGAPAHLLRLRYGSPLGDEDEGEDEPGAANPASGAPAGTNPSP